VGKLDLEHRDRALVDLTLGLRRLGLSAFMREVARRSREVLGVEFCEVLAFLADRDRAPSGGPRHNSWIAYQTNASTLYREQHAKKPTGKSRHFASCVGAVFTQSAR
jgi:hypothetical protein